MNNSVYLWGSQAVLFVGFQFTVNLQIRKEATREQFTLSLYSFKPESQSLRYVAARLVSHRTFDLNPVYPQLVKGKITEPVHRFGDNTLFLVFFGKPIADFGLFVGFVGIFKAN